SEVQNELAHANRVATMGQLLASITHEINQPIGASINYANAALNFLHAQPPDLEEVQQALAEIVQTGVRAGNIIDRIRALVKKASPRKDSLDINSTVLEVTALTSGEMSKNRVSVQTQLAESLPAVHGDRVQIQQVLLNLFVNAAEAMSGTREGPKELLISTENGGSGAVLVGGGGFRPQLRGEDNPGRRQVLCRARTDALGVWLALGQCDNAWY